MIPLSCGEIVVEIKKKIGIGALPILGGGEIGHGDGVDDFLLCGGGFDLEGAAQSHKASCIFIACVVYIGYGHHGEGRVADMGAVVGRVDRMSASVTAKKQADAHLIQKLCPLGKVLFEFSGGNGGDGHLGKGDPGRIVLPLPGGHHLLEPLGLLLAEILVCNSSAIGRIGVCLILTGIQNDAEEVILFKGIIALTLGACGGGLIQ